MIKRGDIFYADLVQGTGSEQNGRRPVVILQNNKGNRHSTTTIAAMITSAHKKSLPTRQAFHSLFKFNLLAESTSF